MTPTEESIIRLVRESTPQELSALIESIRDYSQNEEHQKEFPSEMLKDPKIVERIIRALENIAKNVKLRGNLNG